MHNLQPAGQIQPALRANKTKTENWPENSDFVIEKSY